MGLAHIRRVHLGGYNPAVSSCPAAHSSEWGDDCPSQPGQGILDSDALRPRHAPGDEPCSFEIAKRSGKHTLRDASKMSAQFPVSMRLLFERKQNPGCPPADKDRRRTVRSLRCLHSVLPREKAQLGTHVYPCPGASAVCHRRQLHAEQRGPPRHPSIVALICLVIVLLSPGFLSSGPGRQRARSRRPRPTRPWR